MTRIGRTAIASVFLLTIVHTHLGIVLVGLNLNKLRITTPYVCPCCNGGSRTKILYTHGRICDSQQCFVSPLWRSADFIEIMYAGICTSRNLINVAHVVGWRLGVWWCVFSKTIVLLCGWVVGGDWWCVFPPKFVLMWAPAKFCTVGFVYRKTTNYGRFCISVYSRSQEGKLTHRWNLRFQQLNFFPLNGSGPSLVLLDSWRHRMGVGAFQLGNTLYGILWSV